MLCRCCLGYIAFLVADAPALTASLVRSESYVRLQVGIA